MWFWGRESICNQAHIFPESCLKPREAFCWSRETIISMKDFSTFLQMRRYKNWGYKILYPTIWRPDLLVSPSPPAQSASFLHPELLSGGVEGQQLQQHKIKSLQRQTAGPHGKCLCVAYTEDWCSFHFILRFLFNLSTIIKNSVTMGKYHFSFSLSYSGKAGIKKTTTHKLSCVKKNLRNACSGEQNFVVIPKCLASGLFQAKNNQGPKDSRRNFALSPYCPKEV